MLLLAVFLALLFLYGLVSKRLERSVLTAPMIFTAAGMLAWSALSLAPEAGRATEPFLKVAEAGLVLLLFTDAARTDRSLLRSIRQIPVRLLSAGLLLTIGLGLLAALVVFRQLSVWEAGILAAILAPTDAGLGQVIVTSPRVPATVRSALNVEAGLNDGLCVPFLLFFMALAAPKGGEEHAGLGTFILEQLGYGTAIGVAVGLAGGLLIARARDAGWLAESFEHLAVVTLPLGCALASEAAGASMFIAAFVAGLAVQVFYRDAGRHGVELTEQWGQLLNLAVFFLFGLLVARAWPQFGLAHVAYAVLSLTIVRMLPVALSLWGTGLGASTVAFMGWFGPRGLASIVLGLVYLEHGGHGAPPAAIPLTVMATVLLSIVAHGASAMPGMSLYARRVERLPPDAPELAEAAR